MCIPRCIVLISNYPIYIAVLKVNKLWYIIKSDVDKQVTIFHDVLCDQKTKSYYCVQ